MMLGTITNKESSKVKVLTTTSTLIAKNTDNQ